MYLTFTDYSNNEYSLLKALKRQQKGTTYRYIDVEAKRKNDRITDIYIHYNYASTEYSCWRTSVYIVEITNIIQTLVIVIGWPWFLFTDIILYLIHHYTYRYLHLYKREITSYVLFLQ